MDRDTVINVSIGLKVIRVNDVGRVVLGMPHLSKRNVDHANAMDMAMMRLAYVTFKLVNASVNTTPKEIIVKSVAQIITEIQLMAVNVSSIVNHEEC